MLFRSNLKKELISLAGLHTGDTIFFIADSETRATELAGQIRTELGKRLNLIDDNIFKFCWIVDFPMYELDEIGQISFNHNPFSMPQGGMDTLNTQNPLDIIAYQYDIVCNGIELSSGAVRNHSPEIMINPDAHNWSMCREKETTECSTLRVGGGGWW